MGYLTGAPLAKRIRKVMKEKNPRMCVAFLGPKWPDVLFDEVGMPEGLRVLCDLRMGRTVRKALKVGGAPDNPNLCHLPGQEQVDQAAVDAAPESLPPPARPPLRAGMTLVEAMRANSEAFNGIRFVCSVNENDKDIERKARRKAEKIAFEAVEDGPAKHDPQGATKKFDVSTEWLVKEANWPALFIMVHRGKGGGIYLGKCRHLHYFEEIKVETEDGMKTATNVFAARRLDWRMAGAAFGGLPKFASKKACKKELQGLFPDAESFEPFAGEILTAQKFLKRLGKITPE